MTVEYIRYVLTSHTPDSLVAAYEEAGKHLAAAPECRGNEPTQMRRRSLGCCGAMPLTSAPPFMSSSLTIVTFKQSRKLFL